MSALLRVMGPRWWVALAVLAAFVVVFRTSQVGAPAAARDRAVPADPLIRGHVFRSSPGRPGSLAAEPSAAETGSLREALRAERERSAHLAAEAEALRRRLDSLSALAVEGLDGRWEPLSSARPVAASAPAPAVPVPVEAIYVRAAPEDR